MKLPIILVCITAVFCAPEKRFLFGGGGTFDTSHLKQTAQTLLNVVGSDGTEALCENECHALMTDPTHFLHYSCPLVCHGHAYAHTGYIFNKNYPTGITLFGDTNIFIDEDVSIEFISCLTRQITVFGAHIPSCTCDSDSYHIVNR